MKLTEKECNEALTRLLRPYFASVDMQNVYHSISPKNSIDEDSNLLTLLIMKYFDNQPLKFDELKDGNIYWDDKLKEWCLIYKEDETLIEMTSHFPPLEIKFENDRFYRNKVSEYETE